MYPYEKILYITYKVVWREVCHNVIYIYILVIPLYVCMYVFCQIIEISLCVCICVMCVDTEERVNDKHRIQQEQDWNIIITPLN